MRPVPIRSDVLIRPIEIGSKASTIYLPTKAKSRKINQGIVVALGPHCSEDLETSDHVIFSGYTGDKVTFLEGGVYFLVPEELVVAKLNPAGAFLFDSESLSRIIEDRLSELNMMDKNPSLEEFSQDLLDRLESYTSAEGLEF